MTGKFVTTTLIIFIVLSIVFFAMRTSAPEFHFIALEVGNMVMAIISISSFLIVQRQMNGRPQAFVRGVMGANLLKMMVCLFAILIYVFINRSNIHKPSVFVLMGTYMVYSTMETLLLSKLARRKEQ